MTLTSSDQQAGLPANYTFSAADLGSHTFSVVLKSSGSQAITGTAGSVSGQAAVQVGAAAATNFVVSAPAAATAGASFQVTITAKDAFGNTVTGYTGVVTLSSSDGQHVYLSPSTVTVSGGVAKVAVTLDIANSLKLTAVAGTLKGSSNSIQVSAAAAAKLVFTTLGSTVLRNATFDVTVQLEDQYGNKVPQAGVSIHLAQSGECANGTTNAAGQVDFSWSETQDGNYNLAASASGLTSASAEISAIC